MRRQLKAVTIASLVMFYAVAAFAQQQAPTEQALAQKLMAEIGSGIQCSAGAITLQQQLAAAQAEIRDLKAKLPKADEPPK